MNNKNHSQSLKVQLFVGIVISMTAAVIVFFIFYFFGNVLVDRTFYSEAFTDKMASRQFKRLQSYVLQENITTNKLNQLNAWCNRGEGIYLAIYNDDILIYMSPTAINQEFSADDPEQSESEHPASDMQNLEREFTLVLSDGITAQAFLYYYAGDAYYYLMIGMAGLLAFAVFSLCFITLVNRKLRYIQKLKNELDILAGGNLEYPVTVKGQDELGMLASGIDEMRQSILNHQLSEAEIRSANSQLVTAMSHDLRTPLTSLLAFLELLDMDKVSDEEQKRHLIRQSHAKALDIKSMADKLFEYFLVYTTEWEEPVMELHNADELMSQFWQEYAFALEHQNFTVNTDFQELDGSVLVNIELIRRAFDNLYANLVKYADIDKTIFISYRRENDLIHLRIFNNISEKNEKNKGSGSGLLDVSLNNVSSDPLTRKESTNIGLNTCNRIIRMHNGTMKTSQETHTFCTDIYLPFAK